MSTNKFIKSMIIKISVIIITTIFLFGFLNASDAILSNYLAMGQMENSDSMFIIMEMYNHAISPTIIGIVISIIIYNIISIGIKTYKYFKNKNNNIEENKNEE